jgi:hypothetical protein
MKQAHLLNSLENKENPSLLLKSTRKYAILLFIVVFLSALFPTEISAQHTKVSTRIFHEKLSPYGRWIDHPNYGSVWRPNVGTDFVPYSTGGHWVLSSYGWTWVSDYNWGWAPFHYGRWGYNNKYSWFWVPDNEWGPSWVSWRRANGYYGWAPMAPGITINISFGKQFNNPKEHWVFVRERDFQRSNIQHYRINNADRNRIYRESRSINRKSVDKQHRSFVSGPAREEVQKATGKNINRVVIRDHNKYRQTQNNGQLQTDRTSIQSKSKQTPQNKTSTTKSKVKTPQSKKSDSHTTTQSHRKNKKDQSTK